MASVFVPPDQTRLVTICAHVDHGKTTLADNLIEANGIISERQAGTMRYLDSLEEEQRRGITMRSSAIGLRHVYRPPANKKEKGEQPTNVVVHLLDSPGHMDFSTEVSSSLQCCDGCLLVVDAVEGMCARTHQVVREAHHHQLVPILVINKVDRLCTNLCLSPSEAYLRLRSLVESINAACSAMLTSHHAENSRNSYDEPDETELQHWTFEPAKGNVVFASALYGWGFSVPSLARSLFRQKILPIKPMLLKQYLFGDFKYRPEDSKVLKWKHDHSEDCMFAEFALQPLWEMYEGVATASAACGAGSLLFADGRIVNSQKVKNSQQTKITSTTTGMDQVLAALQSGATANQAPPSSTDNLQAIFLRTGSSAEDSVLRSILRRYRPLSETILDSLYEVCPSPIQASSKIRQRALAFAPPHPVSFMPILTAIRNCDSSFDAPTVAHVCKFMATERSYIRDPELGDDASDSIILGLARVLSGQLRTGDEYYVLGPKHMPDQPAPKKSVRLYLLMGSSFVLVNEVPAGHLCAIQNLEDVQLKTATLCSLPDGRPLQGFDRGVRPLVKVNVEAVDPADTAILERGLIKLSLADAAVEVKATAKGERLLACLGELHLEQSILDLKRIYCGKESMELRISDPIVEFGETTEWFENETSDFRAFCDLSATAPALRQTAIPPYNEEEGLEHAHHGRSRAVMSGRVGAISLRAVPLKDSVYQALKEKKVTGDGSEEMRQMAKALGMKETSADEILQLLNESLVCLDNGGSAIVESAALRQGTTVSGVETPNGQVYVAAKPTPTETKSNYEEDKSDEYDDDDYQQENSTVEHGLNEYLAVKDGIRKQGFSASNDINPSTTSSTTAGALSIWDNQMRGSLIAGFRTALRAGPICEEPLRGILVVLEGVELAVEEAADATVGYKCAKPLSGGMVVSALRTGIRCAMLTRPARLVESHLRLTLHSSMNGIGSLYTVLSKRRGKVVDDSMVEGTDLLLITATIPHAESFGLAPDVYRQSSGEVTAPELIFSHWERLDRDPFWIPTSLEEREDFGEILVNGDVSTGLDNTALKYIRQVRGRKGLLVDSSRTVMGAEKQRTMKR